MERYPLITIIVPCFNIEQYVKACVDSILNQTYQNLEIILVDDGSTDKTGDIVDKYKKEDKRIKVIHRQNGGLSSARNAGLKIAKGEYICFIDGDDFISGYYVEKLLDASRKNNSDVVACGFYSADEFGKPQKNMSQAKTAVELSGTEAFKRYLEIKNYGHSMAWNKLYKTELFKKNKIIYPEGRLHEDEYVIYKLYFFSKKITIIPDSLYFYRTRKTSIMGKKYNSKRLEDELNQVAEVKAFTVNNGIKNVSKELEAYEINIKNYLLKLIVSNHLETSRKNEIIKYLKSKKYAIYHNPYVSRLPKLMYPFLNLMKDKK